eukprot:s188_g26.t1
MAEADPALLKVFRDAVEILCKELAPGEAEGFRKFVAELLKPTLDGYTGPAEIAHPLNHMLLGGKGQKHFPGVNLKDPKDVSDILRSFWRCFSDKECFCQEEGGKLKYFGKFSHGLRKGKVFEFRVNKGESALRSGWEVTDQDRLQDLKNMNLKAYCHRASDALRAGQIGGSLGAGFGAYVFEQLYRKICSDLDHQIGTVEEVSLFVGKSASIPVGSLVGGSVASFVAGFQSVSMLGPMKFQICAALCGAGAGFVVGVAVTGASAAIGFCVQQMVQETEKFAKLAQMARKRRMQLEQYVQNMTDALRSRLEKIASDIGAVADLIDDAAKALKNGVDSVEEVLKWIGVIQVAKVACQQILLALDALEKDVLNHFEALHRTHATTVREFQEAVESQRFGDAARGSIAALTLPLLLVPPEGWILSGVINGVSSAVYHTRSHFRRQRITEAAHSGIVQELGMLELGVNLLQCEEQRNKCKDLLKEVEDLMDEGQKKLNKLIQEAKAEKNENTGCNGCMAWTSLWTHSHGHSDRLEDSWLVQNLIPAY